MRRECLRHRARLLDRLLVARDRNRLVELVRALTRDEEGACRLSRHGCKSRPLREPTEIRLEYRVHAKTTAKNPTNRFPTSSDAQVTTCCSTLAVTDPPSEEPPPPPP